MLHAFWSGNETLQWRHNGRDYVWNHQPRDCLLNRLLRLRSKKTSTVRVTGLCAGNSPGPVNSPHKWPVTRKMFPFDDVIMKCFLFKSGSMVLKVFFFTSEDRSPGGTNTLIMSILRKTKVQYSTSPNCFRSIYNEIEKTKNELMPGMIGEALFRTLCFRTAHVRLLLNKSCWTGNRVLSGVINCWTTGHFFHSLMIYCPLISAATQSIIA